ncbi:MAG: PQQ-dependent sugar dehydrogenase [Bacteroidota bacterium]|nr:PQQ-dependent sugar dehydrogenase [Bacteroidota bacterium]
MKRIIILIVLISSAAMFIAFMAIDQKINAEIDKAFIVDTLAKNLMVPWAFTFIDDKTLLFTERSDKVRLMRSDQLIEKPLLVVKDAATTKKMGLLGLCKHPNFNSNHFIYIAYDYTANDTGYLRVMRYELKADTLVNAFMIVDSIYANQNHTGCRLKFGPDKKLYITTGDADRPMLAQSLRFLNGKILRVNYDGSIPSDNPFVHNDTAKKQIWTYGHRNPQGIDIDPVTNEMYDSEHGPTGGDEINHIIKGKNYAWPIIHHNETKAGMVSPLFQYTPSIGPSEILFYKGNMFPDLRGKLLLASLRGEAITSITLVNDKIVWQEYLLHNEYGRIRALTPGPDGYLYFSTSLNDPPEGNGKKDYDMILRLRPSGLKASHDTTGMSLITTTKISSAKNTSGLYYELCASCHGDKLQGTEKAKSMLDTVWMNGGTKPAIIRSIHDGIINKGMPAWQGAITGKQIEKLTDYILIANKKSRSSK